MMSLTNGIDRADCSIPVYCIYLNATQIEYFVFLLAGNFIVFLSIYSLYFKVTHYAIKRMSYGQQFFRSAQKKIQKSRKN